MARLLLGPNLKAPDTAAVHGNVAKANYSLRRGLSCEYASEDEGARVRRPMQGNPLPRVGDVDHALLTNGWAFVELARTVVDCRTGPL